MSVWLVFCLNSCILLLLICKPFVNLLTHSFTLIHEQHYLLSCPHSTHTQNKHYLILTIHLHNSPIFYPVYFLQHFKNLIALNLIFKNG